jgi:RNA polymerase sigma-70 factor (ECF subfamily)
LGAQPGNDRERQAQVQNKTSSVPDRVPDGLLDRFRQGDIDAFERLFRDHQRAVFGWILRIVRNTAAAEELTVETFWRIYRAHARLDPARGFEGWARRVATHTAIDYLRKQRPETEMTPEQIADLPAPALGDPAVATEIRRKTALAFSRLPPKLRVAATLAVIEELPHKEVAEALGITTAAVKLRVFRAVRMLRKDLTEQGVTP